MGTPFTWKLIRKLHTHYINAAATLEVFLTRGQWPYRLRSTRTSMTSDIKSNISYQLYDLDYLCSHVRLASKCCYWLNLARKCLVAAIQWWPLRLRMRPRCSVTLVASKRHWRSSVNMFLWFSGLKLPSFELVGDRGGPPTLLPLRSLGYEPLTSCLRPK